LNPSISETAEPNSTKFGMSDYVVTEFMCAKFKKKSAGGVFPGAYPTCSSSVAFFCFFVVFFGFMNQGTAQTAEPIFTLNTSKDAVLAKEVPFGGEKISQKLFDPQNWEKPPFPCISMGNKNANNF